MDNSACRNSSTLSGLQRTVAKNKEDDDVWINHICHHCQGRISLPAHQVTKELKDKLEKQTKRLDNLVKYSETLQLKMTSQDDTIQKLEKECHTLKEISWKEKCQVKKMEEEIAHKNSSTEIYAAKIIELEHNIVILTDQVKCLQESQLLSFGSTSPFMSYLPVSQKRTSGSPSPRTFVSMSSTLSGLPPGSDITASCDTTNILDVDSASNRRQPTYSHQKTIFFQMVETFITCFTKIIYGNSKYIQYILESLSLYIRLNILNVSYSNSNSSKDFSDTNWSLGDDYDFIGGHCLNVIDSQSQANKSVLLRIGRNGNRYIMKVFSYYSYYHLY